jgi:hypothetical protein
MTRTTVVLGSVLLIVPSALLPTACSSVTCDETLTCASSDDGGPTSEGGSDTGVDGTAHDAAGDSSADSGDAHVSDSATESGIDCDSGAGLICGGVCVDPSSPANCGSCTSVCPTTADGTATCAKDDGGAYACGQMCGTGYHQCGADCLPNSDDPSDTTDTCVVSESFGIFVSTATGADSTTCGTRAAPCKTIGNGITVAHAASGKRVYVCDDGTYAEQIALTAAVDGAAVYGGFSCTGGTWAYDATKKPLVMLASPTGAASCATCALTATG